MCEQRGIEANEQFNYTLDNSFSFQKELPLLFIVCYSELFYLMFTSVLIYYIYIGWKISSFLCFIEGSH